MKSGDHGMESRTGLTMAPQIKSLLSPNISLKKYHFLQFWLEREKLVVMISSTTGDGEPPDLAGKFWRRLKKKTLPSDHLAHLRFAFVGLNKITFITDSVCRKM